jgi:hypothetical protein
MWQINNSFDEGFNRLDGSLEELFNIMREGSEWKGLKILSEFGNWAAEIKSGFNCFMIQTNLICHFLMFRTNELLMRYFNTMILQMAVEDSDIFWDLLDKSSKTRRKEKAIRNSWKQLQKRNLGEWVNINKEAIKWKWNTK